MNLSTATQVLSEGSVGTARHFYQGRLRLRDLLREHARLPLKFVRALAHGVCCSGRLGIDLWQSARLEAFDSATRVSDP